MCTDFSLRQFEDGDEKRIGWESYSFRDFPKTNKTQDHLGPRCDPAVKEHETVFTSFQQVHHTVKYFGSTIANRLHAQCSGCKEHRNTNSTNVMRTSALFGELSSLRVKQLLKLDWLHLIYISAFCIITDP